MIAFDNETSVELSCEMIDHVRPDGLFQWFGPDNQRITNGVSYTDGIEQVDGSVPPRPVDTTRISTLIISNPDTSDSGNYTCRVEGTNISAVIELLVVGTQPTAGEVALNWCVFDLHVLYCASNYIQKVEFHQRICQFLESIYIIY